MKFRIIQSKKAMRSLLLAFTVFLLSSTEVFAQGLTLESSSSAPVLPSSYTTIALIVFRYALAISLFIAAFTAFKSGINWLYWEGNAKKAKEAKETLANALIGATILFFLLSLLGYFVDYSTFGA